MLKDLTNSYLLAKNDFPNITFLRHQPKEGLYIRLRLDQSWNEQVSVFDSEFMIITKEEPDLSRKKLFEWFQQKDYVSSLISMNKAVDPGKQLHSNNPYTLYAKRDVFLAEPLADGTTGMSTHLARFLDKTQASEVQKKWDELIGTKKTSSKKTSKKTSTETIITSPAQQFFSDTDYAPALEYLVSEERRTRIAQIEQWYATNLSALIEHIRTIPFKNYVKIFFTSESTPLHSSMDHPSNESSSFYSWDEMYGYEYLLYTIPKIFNSNDYNQMVDGALTGLPGFNMSMNSKKPYLEHKTMRVGAPVRLSLEEALRVKEATEWLISQPKFRMNKFSYFTDFSKSISDVAEGYFFVYVEGKDNEVQDFENVPFSKKVHVNIRLKNALGLMTKNNNGEAFVKDYGYLENVEQLQKEISKRFFRGRMNGDFLQDEPKAREKDFTSGMVALFMQSKKGFYDWIFKGTTATIRSQFARVTLRLIEEQLLRVEPVGQEKSKLDLSGLADAMNVRLSLMAYLDGEEYTAMGNRLIAVSNKLKEKLDTLDKRKQKENADGAGQTEQTAYSEPIYVVTDDEFYYLAGQLAFYLKSQSEAQQKKGDLLGPFFMAKRSGQLKKRIEEAYHLHRHKMRLHHTKLNWALGQVYGYQPDKEFQHEDAREMFLAGLFSDNWFWKKGESEKPNSEGENGYGEEN
ncbi:hypothetical protein [Paenibacillus polymyxa]|uniref:hypothetical protein n=1 Tax=Paenibacillus polymyxa TaxID=1406 RepID=UPI002025236B|nr:hypothetical protein [Paenibacillus polymyxa]URJ40792.1 hypothetical protein MF627_000293 [Paenibacillus polymyxa]